jgi:branched-chain amino acid transport system ATP-binding protein
MTIAVSAPILEVTQLSKAFGGLQAVKNVSMAVPVGSLTALIGPNGAGKTTLFALISGFERPDAGEVKLEGQSITGRRPDQIARLGMTRTFQIVQPFAAQTVRENIAVGAHLHEPNRRKALQAAEQIAAQVGLTPMLDRAAADLTVAGRKRLEMARALATRPKLLLLDEVLAGLNPNEIQEVIPVVRQIVASGVTVLMIEHVMQAVMNLAQYVWVLAQGELIAQGSAQAVTQDERVISAYLGHGAAARIQAMGKEAST